MSPLSVTQSRCTDTQKIRCHIQSPRARVQCVPWSVIQTSWCAVVALPALSVPNPGRSPYAHCLFLGASHCLPSRHPLRRTSACFPPGGPTGLHPQRALHLLLSALQHRRPPKSSITGPAAQPPPHCPARTSLLFPDCSPGP